MNKRETFANRTIAGTKLATLLSCYKNQPDGLVLALPRGGVPVAVEIAKALSLPLDLCLVRKLGVPRSRELALGALALNGVRILNQEIIRHYQISPKTIEIITERENQELLRRNHLYRGNQPPPTTLNRTIFLVDDGIATGASIRAAINILSSQSPKQIILASPVIPLSTYQTLQTEIDPIFYLILPENFYSLSFWYEDFTQVTDEEVVTIMASYLG